MKSRRFQPLAVDALEDRLVLTALTLPFSPVIPPAGEVNPKFLNLTGRTQSQINSAISSAFDRFTRDYVAATSAYNAGLAKPGADSSGLLIAYEARTTASFGRLSRAMLDVSHKLPFGGVNLNPLLQNRTVTDALAIEGPNYLAGLPSLKTKLAALGNSATTAAIKSTIGQAQSLVRTDVNDYINLGVTNRYFRLTRGASLPSLS